MNRPSYLIIIIGIILLGLAAGLYLRYQSAPAATPTAGTSTRNVGALPPVTPTFPTGDNPSPPISSGAQNLGVVSESRVLNYFVDVQNSVTLITPDGSVIKITSGSPTTLSSAVIPNIFSALFSFDGKYILVLAGNPTAPKAILFDTNQRTSRTLGVHPVSPAWSPTKDKFAYLAPQPGGTVIKALDATNAKATPSTLLSVGMLDLDLSFADTSHLLLVGKPSALTEGSAWLYDTQKKTFAALALNQNGLMVNWDGIKNMGIYFTAAGAHSGKLGFMNGTTGSTKSFSFLTLASKCAFDNAASPAGSAVLMPALYCAIPRVDDKDFQNATLPDDYLQKSVFTVDDVGSINLATGEVHPIFNDTSVAIDGTQLKAANGRIFFINRYDERLYAIAIGG